MPLLLTDVVCHPFAETNQYLVFSLARINTKAASQFFPNREFRILLEGLPGVPDGNDSRRNKRPDRLPQMVIRKQEPFAIHVREVIWINHPLLRNAGSRLAISNL